MPHRTQHALPPMPEDTRVLCAELARQANDFYPDRSWAELAPLLQRIWLRAPRGTGWRIASAVIHAQWLSHRAPEAVETSMPAAGVLLS